MKIMSYVVMAIIAMTLFVTYRSLVPSAQKPVDVTSSQVGKNSQKVENAGAKPADEKIFLSVGINPSFAP